MAGGEDASRPSSPSSKLLLAEDFQNIQLRGPAFGSADEPPVPLVPVQEERIGTVTLYDPGNIAFI